MNALVESILAVSEDFRPGVREMLGLIQTNRVERDEKGFICLQSPCILDVEDGVWAVYDDMCGKQRRWHQDDSPKTYAQWAISLYDGNPAHVLALPSLVEQGWPVRVTTVAEREKVISAWVDLKVAYDQAIQSGEVDW